MGEGGKHFVPGQAQILNVALRPIGKGAKVNFCGVWHSRGIRRAPFRDVGLIGKG